MNNEQLTAPPAHTVWGTSIPLHWYEFLTKLAESQNLAMYSMLRARMLEHGLTDSDIEIMAERNRIPTLSQKQQLIAKYFKADGLPEWQIPHPKTRRVMSKGRRAVRGGKKVAVAPTVETINATGVWAKLKPSHLDKIKQLAMLKGMPPQELASKVVANWLNLEPDPDVYNDPHASTEPDQQEP